MTINWGLLVAGLASPSSSPTVSNTKAKEHDELAQRGPSLHASIMFKAKLPLGNQSGWTSSCTRDTEIDSRLLGLHLNADHCHHGQEKSNKDSNFHAYGSSVNSPHAMSSAKLPLEDLSRGPTHCANRHRLTEDCSAKTWRLIIIATMEAKANKGVTGQRKSKGIYVPVMYAGRLMEQPVCRSWTYGVGWGHIAWVRERERDLEKKCHLGSQKMFIHVTHKGGVSLASIPRVLCASCSCFNHLDISRRGAKSNEPKSSSYRSCLSAVDLQKLRVISNQGERSRRAIKASDQGDCSKRVTWPKPD